MLAARLGVIRIGLREYPEARHAAEQSIALERDQVMAYVMRVWNAWLWQGDLDASRALLRALPAADDWRFMELRFLQALYERRYDEAVRVLRPFAGTWVRHWIFVRPVVLFEAQAWRLQGDAARAAAAFESARALLAAETAASPDDGRLHGALAVALAGLGRHADAVRHAGRALALMPHPQRLRYVHGPRRRRPGLHHGRRARCRARSNCRSCSRRPRTFPCSRCASTRGGTRSALTRATASWSWRL